MSYPQKKYHFIYKTIDTRNGNFYIGMHSTKNLNDGYIGSGTKLKYLIHKHGKEIFNMEILEFLPNRESLIEREIEIVNSNLLLEEKCMNLKIGGYGGFPKSANEMFLKKMQDNEFKNNFVSLKRKQYYEQLLSGKRKQNPDYFYDWNGKTHTDETKQKLSEVKKGTGVGIKNSQYGTCWITKNNENKKIKKTEINPYLNDGWVRGRNVGIIK
jgi:hypothetical protein